MTKGEMQAALDEAAKGLFHADYWSNLFGPLSNIIQVLNELVRREDERDANKQPPSAP